MCNKKFKTKLSFRDKIKKMYLNNNIFYSGDKMKKEFFKINNIPAVLWGETSEKIIIAVHGNMSHKENVPIKILAETGSQKNYQILSFDLPEHGERKNEKTLCKVQECVKELSLIIEYAKLHWKNISIFGNSIGAYFSLLAFKNENISNAFFLSPVVDMERIIKNMMLWFDVSEEKLEKEKTILTPIGQNLYWDYYSYVKENPIINWNISTYILYGEKDNLCEKNIIMNFAEKFNCDLLISNGSEHWFHTENDLKILKNWYEKIL